MRTPTTLPNYSSLDGELHLHLRPADVQLVKLFKDRKRRSKGITSWELNKRFGEKWPNAIARLRRKGFKITSRAWGRYRGGKLFTLAEIPEWASGSAPAPISAEDQSAEVGRNADVEPDPQGALFQLVDEPVSAVGDYEPDQMKAA